MKNNKKEQTLLQEGKRATNKLGGTTQWETWSTKCTTEIKKQKETNPENKKGKETIPTRNPKTNNNTNEEKVQFPT